LKVRRNASAIRAGCWLAAIREASCRTFGLVSDEQRQDLVGPGLLRRREERPIAAIAASWTRVESLRQRRSSAGCATRRELLDELDRLEPQLLVVASSAAAAICADLGDGVASTIAKARAHGAGRSSP
jgi:hypothetical protein